MYQQWRVLLIILLMAQGAIASSDTIGPNGINSAALPLTGDGISIGQVEIERSGLPGFDNGSNSNFGTVPAAVFIENGVVNPTANAMERYLMTAILQSPMRRWWPA